MKALREMRVLWLVAALIAAAPGCAREGARAGGNSGAAGHSGAFATGQYRNLFVEAGHSHQEVTNRIQAAWRKLFHGDPATEAVCFAAGTNATGPLAYICDIGHKDVRSEGLSYGMMIAVQMDAKAEFDALWNWARTFSYQDSPDHPSYGYFSWQLTTNGAVLDAMPAPDGEAYFAMALYFAANRWGNGSGIYNYKAQADTLLGNLLHRQIIRGTTVNGPRTAGAIFDTANHMVRFTPDVENWNHTDPSYQLPAFYELWARWGPAADRPFWTRAATASREFFRRTTHPTTGLSPEYANFDGSPWAAPWNPYAADFAYDACRTAMNWSVDWAWWGADERQREMSDRLQSFFETRGLHSQGSVYTLDGRPIVPDNTTSLMAMNAVASLASTRPLGREFAEVLWNTPVPTGEWRYYDGLLYLFAWLHCSGEFRIWMPR